MGRLVGSSLASWSRRERRRAWGQRRALWGVRIWRWRCGPLERPVSPEVRICAGGDDVADLDVYGAAVAVGPAHAGVVVDGDADPAGGAPGRVGAAAVVPPVVRPVLDGGDTAAAHRVDGRAARDRPVPCRVVVVRAVDGRGGEHLGRAGVGVPVAERPPQAPPPPSTKPRPTRSPRSGRRDWPVAGRGSGRVGTDARSRPQPGGQRPDEADRQRFDTAQPGELVELLGAAGLTPAATVAVLRAERLDAETVAGLLPIVGVPMPDAILLVSSVGTRPRPIGQMERSVALTPARGPRLDRIIVDRPGGQRRPGRASTLLLADIYAVDPPGGRSGSKRS